MNDRKPEENLLDELAADAPLRCMRARFEESIAELPRAEEPRAERPRTVRLVWAAAAAIALAGLLAVLTRTPATSGPDARAATVLEMLEARSAFERLRAVNAAADLPESWPFLRPALLERLERDDSVNVRLSVLDVLLDREAPEPGRLIAALLSQETAIVQAHLGYQLRYRQLLGRDELTAILARPDIHNDARNVLERLEEL